MMNNANNYNAARTELDGFTRGYLGCALWASVDDNGEPLDAEYGVNDIAPQALATMAQETAAFQAENAALLERWYQCGTMNAERAGHDFWLTRNHHGAGFWDRFASGTPEGKIGQELTDAAHASGSRDLYVDDNLVYQQG